MAYQHNSIDDLMLSGARVQQEAASGWIARLGVRVKGDLAIGSGLLQPYGRVNVYRSNTGDDIATFIGPTGTTAISSGSDYSAGETAVGMTLTLTPEVSFYGEAGYLWNIGGDARVKSSMEASLGIKVRW
ncbi:outer membrane autotransporter protein [Dyella japonica]|uniref:Outer membrane autotransporter protein n=2 Tax=Dyella japonica TaxID=231455 RepID=A0ABV2K142_9GAMM